MIQRRTRSDWSC